MLRVAMISKWHVHAGGYAKFIQGCEDACVSCVWDDDAARGEAWAKELNVPFVADYDELLARDDVDAVLVDTPTNMHKEILIKAAKAKKHIFTEKVMCLTVADCDEVIKAVKENGVIFTISFPQRCSGRNLFIKQMIDEGKLGDVTLLRVRNCHDGALAGWLPDYWYDPETTGGGAMMDLGAHPMYLARWMLGQPTRIQSMFNNLTPHPVEDNSVCTIEFANKAIAISETSLVSPMTPAILEVYGTKGVIMAVGKDIRMMTKESKDMIEGGWFTPKLPDDLPMPLRQWIDSILYGKEVRFGLEEGRQLTELMEKAYIADREKREVAFCPADMDADRANGKGKQTMSFTDNQELSVSIRIGTETDKQRIIEQYPHTGSVISAGGYLILAELGDEIVGFLWAFKRKIPAPVEQDEIFVNVIDVIEPNLRRKGLACRMIDEAKALAEKENVYQIRAYCDIENIASHRLWAKNGFTINPVKMPDGTIRGSFVSLICR